MYLSFFSHLVAGPIVRASEFLPQIEKPRDPNNVAVGAGVFLIAVGLIKKVAIADYLAREVVDPVFAVPEAFMRRPDVIFGAYAYAAQIYCDFSGYTDMAIGLALLMGIVFPQNFNRPYRSRSIREFWRRWHITLSRFLRDYLYIPLGGNRGGRRGRRVNLMITMLLGGLWHGAAWGFVLWGGIHGTALVVEHPCARRDRVPGWLKWFITFHIVVLAWIVFRAPDLCVAGELFAQLGDWGEATVITWTTPHRRRRDDRLPAPARSARPASCGCGSSGCIPPRWARRSRSSSSSSPLRCRRRESHPSSTSPSDVTERTHTRAAQAPARAAAASARATRSSPSA